MTQLQSQLMTYLFTILSDELFIKFAIIQSETGHIFLMRVSSLPCEPEFCAFLFTVMSVGTNSTLWYIYSYTVCVRPSISFWWDTWLRDLDCPASITKNAVWCPVCEIFFQWHNHHNSGYPKKEHWKTQNVTTISAPAFGECFLCIIDMIWS